MNWSLKYRVSKKANAVDKVKSKRGTEKCCVRNPSLFKLMVYQTRLKCALNKME